MAQTTSYADAGVDIDLEAQTIKGLVSALSFSRQGPGAPLGPAGGFSGLVDLGELAMGLCTDGVGTKLLIAKAMDKWDTVGIDCIAMNVNDLLCAGVEPLAFVDYLAVAKPDPVREHEIGKGLNAGAELSNITICGGETATVPDLVKDLDLAGTAVGIVPKERVIDGSKVAIGDAIVGIPSDGVHSNGFTLIRRIVDEQGAGWDHIPDLWERSLGEVFLTPTRIYVREVLPILAKHTVHGIAHITGGGLRNIPRINGGFRYIITDPLPYQPEFFWIWGRGVEDREMFQTFNMGMGMALVVPEGQAEAIAAEVGGKVVGHVEAGTGVVHQPLGLTYSSL